MPQKRVSTTATWLLLLVALAVMPLSSSQARCSSNRFDGAIVSAVALEWRDFNRPSYWKAQLCQESALNPDAQSGTGAQGLAQFMPGTWRDIVRSFKWDSAFASPFDPGRAILAGARYQGRQRRMWSAAGRTQVQRNDLGLCNYNAGPGNCLTAQRLCDDAKSNDAPPLAQKSGAWLWPEIARCLPQVTGRHAAETIGYVAAVNRFAPDMRLP